MTICFRSGQADEECTIVPLISMRRPIEHTLQHTLEPYLPWLAAIPSRRLLNRDPIYRKLRGEIDRVVAGLEWRLEPLTCAPRRPFLRAVAWNIERGKRFDGIARLLRHDPLLREADLLYLTEVDIGMDRSGGRNVARELADLLGMGYVFANGYLLLSPGDRAERRHAWPTGLSLHGNALLSRHPIARFDGVALPEFKDRFHAVEKRLGQKRALIAEVRAPDGPITIAVVHTDPFAPPKHRAAQMRRVLAAVERYGNRRVLLGGDLNTNTWNFGGPVRLTIDWSHKALRFGRRTFAHFLEPDRLFERPLFRALEEHGLITEGWNEPAAGTTYFDLSDEAALGRSRDYLPKFALRYLERRLAPWGGVLPLRIDWFAARELTPAPGHLPDTVLAATTCRRPTVDGQLLSDHDPIVADVALGAPT
jgi:endonuclease/exonuclease/phosphatase family metal-dependent hydrolase